MKQYPWRGIINKMEYNHITIILKQNIKMNYYYIYVEWYKSNVLLIFIIEILFPTLSKLIDLYLFQVLKKKMESLLITILNINKFFSFLFILFILIFNNTPGGVCNLNSDKINIYSWKCFKILIYIIV